MTVEELANKRYGGEFVFMFGHLEGRTRFVPVEERISVLLKDRKKKVVSIFYIILIMVVCKAVIL